MERTTIIFWRFLITHSATVVNLLHKYPTVRAGQTGSEWKHKKQMGLRNAESCLISVSRAWAIRIEENRN